MQRSCDCCKGDGRGGDGRGVANGHMTVGGRGRRGRGQGGGRGGKGGGSGRGPTGARQARHFGPVRPVILGTSGPSSLGLSGSSSGSVRPAQYKARGLAAGLKKN